MSMKTRGSSKAEKNRAAPYSKNDVVSLGKSTITIGTTKYRDTNGGFLLIDQPNEEKKLPQIEEPLTDLSKHECESCSQPFIKSWLFDKFGHKCCDRCKEDDEYKLITKTEAKTVYLLQDCDLDKRDPPLKFVKQKNPHNARWGDMKLYLRLQVEKRALEVWESMERIEEEKEHREEKKVLAQTKKYEKKLKELKMGMRSSLYNRTKGAFHTHEFGPEMYNEEDDIYTRTCLTCSYEESFEKM
ncbi:DNA repair protein complementing XP-A cells homolog [Sitophilus oryzae]|uniref:DNA repair protein complementing XP-A cells homolog n=1 Tax=Sitophilus oryzae TaxID=7048 RepID=A0A6J2XB06_SITOR|nr:DNA repair protein complementing XP-A cells homolog [Sitophilus oryzae]